MPSLGWWQYSIWVFDFLYLFFSCFLREVLVENRRRLVILFNYTKTLKHFRMQKYICFRLKYWDILDILITFPSSKIRLFKTLYMRLHLLIKVIWTLWKDTQLSSGKTFYCFPCYYLFIDRVPLWSFL